ncbi:DUF333 domain-containing protein [Acetobacter sp. TBRC 12305]|uniref:DUF333 domain-containing protein n=1 Tax=Acetobacter garciniae TaxID=2817435 RepID=A0A939KPN7_9PROT|nr:DUF333 domain-containing protein [Acetobacter garciniae]MBO1324147.1 DUF333 domain-containing protein [Acetobacter garciniae]MBX0343836.1 DUF333 domain-containing protein [Acetobacter garciniae]
MKNRKTIATAVLATAMTGILGGCQHHEGEGGQSYRSVRPLRIPNPASLYCVKKGGTLSMEHTEQGQVGYCHLPDGSVTEEWALFRKDHPQPADADTAKPER